MIVFCTAATAALAIYNLTKGPAETGVTVVDPTRFAFEARADGDRLMKAGRFKQAIVPYERARDELMALRRDHPGEGYSWLDNEIAWTNVRLRAARENAASGGPFAPHPPTAAPGRMRR